MKRRSAKPEIRDHRSVKPGSARILHADRRILRLPGSERSLDRSSVVDSEKQAFLAAIARCVREEFRPQGRPSRVALEFSLMLGLNYKIVRVRRQLVRGSEVGYGRANIKEIRLKVRIDRLKPLTRRKERVNLCGNRFNSLVPL